MLALGALYDIVHGKHWDIDWRMLLRLAFDAAKGCIFLHGRKPPVVHCDLKSPNVLVSADWLGKLGDFGLSNMAEHTLKGKAVADASPLWASPEALRAEPQGTASDVFALGTLIWECLTRYRPFEGQCVATVVMNVARNGARADEEGFPKLRKKLQGNSDIRAECQPTPHSSEEDPR